MVASIISLEDQVVFWSRMSREESVPDTRVVRPQGMVMWGLVQPITVDEIFSTLRKTKISCKDTSKLNRRSLQAHFNLWLYAGYQPGDFRRSRKVLIPKVAEPSRPIQADRNWVLHLQAISQAPGRAIVGPP